VVMTFDPPVSSARFFVADIDNDDAFTAVATSGGVVVATLTVAAGETGTGNGANTEFFLAGEDIDAITLEVDAGADGVAGYAVDFLTFTRRCEGSDCGPLIEVAQESSAGAGDFNNNVLDVLLAVPFTSTPQDFYAYDVPSDASWNGQSLDPVADRSHVIFAETTDGLTMFVVHDAVDDPSGGSATMAIDITGDPDGAFFSFVDDPGEGPSCPEGSMSCTSVLAWSDCCTDGYAVSGLDGGFVLTTSFSSFTGMGEWVAYSADGDETALVLESDRRVRFRQLALPDLVPTAVMVDADTVFRGETVTVDADVVNAGDIAATGAWTDRVYLSADGVLDSGDTLVGPVARTGPIAGGDGYSAQLMMDTTGLPIGTFTVLFEVDGAMDVDEGEAGEANNVLAAAGTLTIEPPPVANLVVSDIVISCPTPTAGTTLSGSYTVTNEGSLAATGPWSDEVVLVIGGFPAGSIAIAPDVIELAPGESYTQTLSQEIPLGSMGSGLLRVRTDTLNVVTESSEADNTLDDDETIAIQVGDVVTLACWRKLGRAASGNWQVSGDGLSVLQTINGSPTFFVSDFDLEGSRFSGTFGTTNGDDDFMGFVFGVQEIIDDTRGSGTYYLFDWKARDQSVSDGFGERGFKIRKITGNNPNLWNGENQEGVQEILARFDSSVDSSAPGYARNVTYTFTLTYQVVEVAPGDEEGRIRVIMRGPGNELLWDSGLVIDADPLGAGPVGFYNFSQPSVTYSGFARAELQPPLANAGGPYDASAGTPTLTLDGSGSEDPDGEAGTLADIVAFDWTVEGETVGDEATVPLTIGDLIDRGLSLINDLDATLTVTDADGLTDQISTTVRYLNTPPIADAGGPYGPLTPSSGITVLNGTATDADLTLVVGEALRVEWDSAPASTGADIGDGFASTATATLTFEEAVAASRAGNGFIYFNIVDASGAVSSSPVALVGVASDLIVPAVSVTPREAAPGDALTLSWTVRNIGSEAAAGTWRDRVGVSVSATGEPAEYLVVDILSAGPIGVDETKTFTTSVGAPAGRGSYFGVAQANWRGDLPELDLTNNRGVDADAFEVGAPDYTGAVLMVTTPVVAGESIAFDYRVSNEGTSDGRSTVSNRVYLSSDASLDAGDTLLGELSTAALATGESRDLSGALPISIELDAEFFLLIELSVGGDEELTRDNNVLASAVFTVEQPPLADLAVLPFVTPSEATTDDTVMVDFTFANLGEADADGLWLDRVLLSTSAVLDGNETVAALSTPAAAIPAGGQEARTISITLPGEPGSYFVIVQTDSNNDIEEGSSEGNNVTVSAGPIVVSAPPPADLFVEGLVCPSEAVAGSSFAVNWTRGNAGTGDARGGWLDQLVLSDDTVLGDEDDVILSTFSRSGPFAAGDSEAETAEVSIPISLQGAWFLFAVTDALDAVAEPGETAANSVLCGPIDISQPDLPDLVVRPFSGPSNAETGQTISVAWLTANEGETEAVGPWTDRVVLSEDAVLSGDDFPLGSVVVDEVIFPSHAASSGIDVTLPDRVGTFFIIVQADAAQQVTEGADEGNNATASAVATIVVERPKADLVVAGVTTPAEGVNGGDVSVSYTVANIGAVDATGTWTERVLASPDASFTDTNNILIGTFSVTETIIAGAPAVTRTLSVLVPNLPDGYFVGVRVNPDAGVGAAPEEFDTGNNLAVSAGRAAVSLPDLVPAISTAATSGKAGTGLELSYSVTNAGGVSSNAAFITQFVLSPVGDDVRPELTLGSAVRTTPLGAGETVMETRTFTVPPSAAGAYELCAVTDVSSAVRENGLASPGGEDNNRVCAAGTLTIAERDKPELAVSILSAPTAGVADGLLTMTYEVSNTGDAATALAFVTRITLTPTSGGGTPVVLATRVRSLPLGAGESFTREISAQIPSRLEGSFDLCVTTDATSVIAEATDETGNNTACAVDAFVVSQPPRPNLVVASIATPNGGLVGGDVALTYTVDNLGGAAPAGSWSERVLARPIGGGADVTLAETFQSSVGPRTINAAYPLEPGLYELCVIVDSSDAVIEVLAGGEDDNELCDVTPFEAGTYVVSVDAEVSGRNVTLSGRSFTVGGDPIGGVAYAVDVTVQGTTRTFRGTTADGTGENPEGFFAAMFNAIPNEAGFYNVFAGPPGDIGDVPQDQFQLFALSVNPPRVEAELTSGSSVLGTFQLRNLGDNTLTGLTARTEGLPAGVMVSLAGVPASLGPNGAAGVSVEITSMGSFSGNATGEVFFETSLGAGDSVPLSVLVFNPEPSFVLEPGDLRVEAPRGRQTTVPVTIRSTGSVPVEDIRTRLLEGTPSWIRVATPMIPDLAPAGRSGDTATLLLQLLPDDSSVAFQGPVFIEASGGLSDFVQVR
ncbi:MAG: CARDB domain-containing protein, partial [Planctomycetota bacterium]